MKPYMVCILFLFGCSSATKVEPPKREPSGRAVLVIDADSQADASAAWRDWFQTENTPETAFRLDSGAWQVEGYVP